MVDFLQFSLTLYCLKNKKVMEVNYPQDLINDVNRNIKRISMFLLGLAALLTLISFALINNTIRLAIHSKRFLIHTMKLVGASWSFIRRPFLVRNTWIGVISSILADAKNVVVATANGVACNSVTQTVCFSRYIEHCLSQRSLTAAAVAEQHDVANVFSTHRVCLLPNSNSHGGKSLQQVDYIIYFCLLQL